MTHRLLDPIHAIALPYALAIFLLLFSGGLQGAPEGEQEEDGFHWLGHEGEEIVVEGEEVLE